MTTLPRYHTTMGLICTLGAVWALVALLLVLVIALVAFGGFWGVAAASLLIGAWMRSLYENLNRRRHP
jgi:hypothetical protein